MRNYFIHSQGAKGNRSRSCILQRVEYTLGTILFVIRDSVRIYTGDCVVLD